MKDRTFFKRLVSVAFLRNVYGLFHGTSYIEYRCRTAGSFHRRVAIMVFSLRKSTMPATAGFTPS